MRRRASGCGNADWLRHADWPRRWRSCAMTGSALPRSTAASRRGSSGIFPGRPRCGRGPRCPCRGGTGDLGGQGDVFAGRGRVAAGVVVGQDDRGGVQFQAAADDLARVGGGVVDGAVCPGPRRRSACCGRRGTGRGTVRCARGPSRPSGNRSGDPRWTAPAGARSCCIIRNAAAWTSLIAAAPASPMPSTARSSVSGAPRTPLKVRKRVRSSRAMGLVSRRGRAMNRIISSIS